MNYCPETVLVHSAFLLANNVAARSLNELERGKCSQAVQIISGAIREITQESLLGEKLLQVEVRQLEFKIHSWLFSSLFSSYGGLECGELSEEEYFDSFPPLPQIGVGFYLELVQEVGWSELLVEVCKYIALKPAIIHLCKWHICILIFCKKNMYLRNRKWCTCLHSKTLIS